MSHLIALVFDDQFKGEEARTALHHMAGEGRLNIADTVLIAKKRDGKIAVSQEDRVTGQGQKTGHVVGLVAAAITGTFPFILTGAMAGRLVGRLMDHGVAHKFVQNVKQAFEPGTSALIILADSDPERRQVIADRLQEFGPKVLESDLPPNLQRDLEQEIDDARAA
jgi:uncharacterized membrane protein